MIGIDEVGRGAWAGPLVVAAVYLLKNIEGLKDSKALTQNKRKLLAEEIKRNSYYYIEWVQPSYIDMFGLSYCLEKGFNEAYKGLILQKGMLVNKKIIIDGQKDYISNSMSSAVVKADTKYNSVSAASIIAKVARDSYMIELSKTYKYYFFYKNVGYGTKQHIDSIKQYGIINGVHRRSFKPMNHL